MSLSHGLRRNISTPTALETAWGDFDISFSPDALASPEILYSTTILDCIRTRKPPSGKSGNRTGDRGSDGCPTNKRD